jgi:hypothetical protein
MAAAVIHAQKRQTDNIFFPGMAVLILAIVFLGFARSYYLAGVFQAPLPNRNLAELRRVGTERRSSRGVERLA